MNNGDENNTELLTVHEIARLLKVPVSWVYGHTRKRSIDRLAGISPWEVLAFPCRRSNGLGAAPEERSRSSLTCGLH